MDEQTPKAQRGQRVRITKGPRAGREGVVHKRCSASFPDRLYVTLDKSPRERKQKREQFGDDEVTAIGTGVSTGAPATTEAEWSIERQRHADALAAAEKEIVSLRADRDFLKRREQSIIEDCERVADGGKYRADIMSAIRRIRTERDENAAKVTALEAAQTALQDEVARLRREVLAAAASAPTGEPADETTKLRHALTVSQQDAIAARRLVRAQAETMTDERAAAEDAHLARIAALEAEVAALKTDASAAANDRDLARSKTDDLRAMYAAATLSLRVDVPAGLLFKPQEEWPCDGNAILFHHDEELGLVRADGSWQCFLDEKLGKAEPKEDEPPCDAGARALLAHLDETDQRPTLAASDAEVTTLRVRLRRVQEDLDETREELRQARPSLQERLRGAITNLSNDAAEIDRLAIALRNAIGGLTDGEASEAMRGDVNALAVLAERIASTKRRDGRPLGEVAVCATYKTPAEIAAIAAVAEPPPRWRAAKVEVSEAQTIARQLTVRSPWPPGAILIYVVDGDFPPALLVAVDYLMMSSSPDFSYRRAYMLSVQDGDPGAPRAEPPCASFTYQVATPTWTWTFEPRPLGEYHPYRLPAETKPAPPPPPPPAPSPPPRPIMSTRERVTGAARGWIINGRFVRESDDGAVFEGKSHRW